MSTYFEKTNRFPNKLTNLVVQNASGTPVYEVPTVSDDDPDNGPETLAKEFDDRNHFKIHILDADEAAELKNMGVVTLLNLNSYDNSSVADADQEPAMNEVEPIAGVGVAMVGVGYDGTAWDVPTSADERDWGEPDWFGRIVLGLGPECGLITTGIIGNAAHCPGGIQNADNATYNDYNLVLPRLESTVARFNVDGTTTSSDLGIGTVVDDDTLNLEAVCYDDEPDAGYVIADNDDNLRVRTFNIAEVQETWQYATQCPEGHMYPEDDGEFWGIDVDANGNID
jgi:hypothetical protein